MAVYDIEINPSTNKLIAGTFARSIWTIDISAITGITPVLASEQTSLFLYPSPATEVVHIDFGNKKILSLNIFDSNGKAVFSKENNFQDNNFIVPVTNFANGVYIVKVKDEKSEWVEKFVKINQ